MHIYISIWAKVTQVSDVAHVYAPVSKEQGKLVFWPICLPSVCLSAKTLTLAISFEWYMIGLSYFMYVIFMTRPVYWYRNF
jgi:hypothetical protein